ncbi:TerB family tellurite resistance protein [Maricaulis sp. D1M11]|uniref:TerB family tellurite resistance protein n=1 Tax=Maricaulis sp. D1M11 TaxID=3076117 RepID=UPI0039B3E359
MGFWRAIAERIRGRSCFLECEGEDCEPGRRVDDADFAMALIGLGAKMAKADGIVTRNEVEAFTQVFKLPEEGAEPLRRAFDLAKQTTLGFDGYARRLARRFRAHPAILEDVLDGLFHIAKADGVVSRAERDFLDRVADIFGFSDLEYRRIRNVHLGAAEDDPYLILGVEPDISEDGLKRAYRRIAAQNHPDRLVSRGVPPEMQRLAVDKMAAINIAYARICDERARLAGVGV